METMKLNFPHNEQVEFEYGKPVVLLGANGAGKTRFSIKIEDLNDPSFSHNGQFENSHIHRLSAQKSLTIDDSISILDYDSSERNLFLGHCNRYAYKNSSRYNNNPATYLLNDYQFALSLLFAEGQKAMEKDRAYAKECVAAGIAIPVPIDTVVEKTVRIWNTLLPHRTIDLSGNGVHVIFNGQRYHGKEMSDGERVMLYMIIQALVVKPNSLFIIDEPELHIHKAIVKELWTLLENERPDCVFMYLTHDIDFAASRTNAQYLWIKSFNGTDWKYEFLDVDDYSDLPDDLLLEIIGTRQKIVFVEGTKDSYDYKLYQELFRDRGYHVIPCGGCQEVVRLVKAKRTYEKLQAIEVYGIVDRDFRVDGEIQSLQDDGVYVLEVAEVENLFVVPGLLEIMETQLGCDSGTAERAKQFIINLYSRCKNKQIAEALSKEISHQLSLFDIGANTYTNEEIKRIIDEKYTLENIAAWRAEKETIFNAATTLDGILKVFNFKELSKKIGTQFRLSGSDYPKRVLNILKRNDETRSQIKAVLSHYIPQLP